MLNLEHWLFLLNEASSEGFLVLGPLLLLAATIKPAGPWALASRRALGYLQLLLSLGASLTWLWYAGSLWRIVASSDEFELYALVNRAFGAYGWAFWLLIAGQALLLLGWWSRFRRRLSYSLAVVGLLLMQTVLPWLPVWFPRLLNVPASSRWLLPGETHYGRSALGLVGGLLLGFLLSRQWQQRLRG